MAGVNDTLIIAIDFGTTYSGIGYIHAAEDRLPGIQNLVTHWPPRVGTSEKTPTEIVYDDNQNTILWGFQAQGEIRAIKYFKLELDPDARSKLEALRSATESTRSFGRTHRTTTGAVVGEYEVNRDAKALCTDYLKAIYRASLEHMRHRIPDFARRAPKRFILTVPAIWTDQAKNATKQCARRALGQHANIELIAEPQAAAVYTLKQGHMVGSVRPGDHYIICDAGGGTVDLITYCVKRIDPLELVESIPGTGEACGSIFLNRAFEAFLEDRLGRYYSGRRTESLEKWLQRTRQSFELDIKQQFTGDRNARWDIWLPPELYGAQIHGTEENCLIITGRDVIEMFKPTITRVLSLIREQLTTLLGRRSQRPRLAGILLVGGFGQNRYIYKKVRDEFQQLTQVTQPPDAWASVALGALCWGMSNKTVTARKLTRCYGQEVHLKYNPDCGYPVVPHPVTGERSHKAMQWFVEAGDEVSVDHPLEFLLVAYCDPSGEAKLPIDLWAWSPSREGERPPKVCTRECYKVGDMIIDLQEPRRNAPPPRRRLDGQGYYQVLDFTMQLVFANEIVFRAVFHGTSQYARVDYTD
ncbi:hypothetical protein AFCA_002447 [Aspergillus flavus]|uniref:Actin-like ATPase domain-containing protein n=1 Tax=Aspergillus flavus TaxID=5059 RepID=A0AB74C2D5_ASPFL|nr:hypothetical protein AFLA_012272 [Aspergillus flavus NRRL3357]KAJ1709072.1 hypothetical protein NYO67_8765 [Aspergillus flavus]RAQ65387.1 hypothetical protein COH20_012461 [Aspergillus flavus]RAQ66635.1 hypothetical protein COH21_011717 [Aspergillus flavus]RMZ39612.1 hypothetical protein CA14_010078 [Aspergillus flavus]